MPQGFPTPSLLIPCPDPGGIQEIVQACLNSALPFTFQTHRLHFTTQEQPSQDPNERMNSHDVPAHHLGLVNPSSILILQVRLERLPGAVAGWGTSSSSLSLARGTCSVSHFSN